MTNHIKDLTKDKSTEQYINKMVFINSCVETNLFLLDILYNNPSPGELINVPLGNNKFKQCRFFGIDKIDNDFVIYYLKD
jgi:hypothetical protein